jgi:hypothetical protein
VAAIVGAMQTEPSPPTPAPAFRPVPLLLVLLLLPLLASACSVANPFAPKSAAANKDEERAMVQWAQCMRSHGVNVPDPGSGPTTGAVAQPGDEQQVQAAENACKKYMPNGRKQGRSPDPKQLDAMAKFTQCMRDHGIPMQDPTANGGTGKVISEQAGSGPDPNSDQFKQAQKDCQKYMDAAGIKTRTSGGAAQGPGGGPATQGSR